MKLQILALLSLFFFVACKKEESKSKNFITYKFEQPTIYLDKDCPTAKDILFQIEAQGNIHSSIFFEIFLDEFILDTVTLLSPAEKGDEMTNNNTNAEVFILRIPNFKKYNRKAMNLKIAPLNHDFRDYTFQLPVEYLQEGDVVEFTDSPINTSQISVFDRGTWPKYNGELIPHGHEYLIESKSTINDYKNKDGNFRRIKYEVTLVDQESKNKIKITPPLVKTVEVPKIYDFKEGTIIKETPTEVLTIGYSTKNFNEPIFPAYQLYSQISHNRIKARMKACHELEIIDKIKLMLPHHFEFFGVVPLKIDIPINNTN